MVKDTTPVIITRAELESVRESAAIVHKSYKARTTVLTKIDALLDRFPKPKVKKAAPEVPIITDPVLPEVPIVTDPAE